MGDQAARVAEAFGGEAGEERAKVFLEEVRAQWRSADSDFRRRVTFFVLVFVAGELIANAKVGRIEALGAEIDDTDVILRAVPVILAYLLYEILSTVVSVIFYQDIHETVLRQVFPKLVETELHKHLEPHNSMVSGDRRLISGKIPHWFHVLSTAKLLGIMFLPLGIEVMLIGRLFGRFGASDLPTWIAAGLVACVVAYALAYLNLVLDSEL